MPSQQRFFRFRVVPLGETEHEGRPALRLRMEARSRLLRFLVDPIHLTYDLESQRLLVFEGLSNISGDGGEKLEARIVFDYGEDGGLLPGLYPAAGVAAPQPASETLSKPDTHRDPLRVSDRRRRQGTSLAGMQTLGGPQHGEGIGDVVEGDVAAAVFGGDPRHRAGAEAFVDQLVAFAPAGLGPLRTTHRAATVPVGEADLRMGFEDRVTQLRPAAEELVDLAHAGHDIPRLGLDASAVGSGG